MGLQKSLAFANRVHRHTGGFFSLQTLSSIILIMFTDFVMEKQIIIYYGNYVNWVYIILKSALQVAQASCFLPNCYCRFITQC